MSRGYIFQDLDGCLANFLGSALALFGKTLNDWKENAWDFEGGSGIGISEGEMWKAINDNQDVGRQFWANLDKLHDADELVKLVEEVAKKIDFDVVVLSSPSMGKLCEAGKKDWLSKYYPKYCHPSKCIFTSRKELLAGGGMRVLIDDSDSNIAKFNNAGGHGILVPRKWNQLHGIADKTVDYVKQELLNYVDRFHLTYKL